jgi:hypothetical protein
MRIENEKEHGLRHAPLLNLKELTSLFVNYNLFGFNILTRFIFILQVINSVIEFVAGIIFLNDFL